MSAPFWQGESHPRTHTTVPVMPAAIGVGAWHVLGRLEEPIYTPVYEGAVIHPLPALVAGVIGVCSIKVLEWSFLRTADWLEKVASRTPRYHKASGGWAMWKDIRHAVWAHYGWTAWWGQYAGPDRKARGRLIMVPYKSNAVTFGPAGAGKGEGVVIPTSMALAQGGEPLLVMDFKTANVHILLPFLKRLGHRVHIVNLGGMDTDSLGESACYNTNNIISDNFFRPDGILMVNDDLAEQAMQLLPEPESDAGGNFYFREGGRGLIIFTNRQGILTYGPQGNLGHAYDLVSSREALMKECLWITGQLAGEDGETSPAMPLESAFWATSGLHDPADVKAFIDHHRAQAAELLSMLQNTDSNAYESFSKGAQQALAPFSKTSRAHKIMSHSTFRPGQMKDGGIPTHMFICVDPSASVRQLQQASLIQWAALTEWKRHPNKHNKLTIIGDECTNIEVFGLPELQSFGRELGIRWHGFIQSLFAYRKVYGKEAVSTLLSNAEILQFLPQQSDPETLELIQKMLAQRAIITESFNSTRDEYGVKGHTTQEDARPLMTMDEIRRTDKTILFIRNSKPVLTTLPSYSAIHPWRKQVGRNPFYPKAYLTRIKVRLGKRRFPLHWRVRWRLQSAGERILNTLIFWRRS